LQMMAFLISSMLAHMGVSSMLNGRGRNIAIESDACMKVYTTLYQSKRFIHRFI
jgi:hypothetical protein